MAQANTPQTEAPKDPAGMTAAEAAKLVFREVPATDKDGKPTGKTEKVAISPEEVFAWRDYGDHVVVVTTDGQKFSGEKKARK